MTPKPVLMLLSDFRTEQEIKGRLATADLIMAHHTNGQKILLWDRPKSEAAARGSAAPEYEGLEFLVRDDAELATLRRIVNELKKSD